jgi:hypothetical protein
MGIVVDAVELTSQPETAKRKPARASAALAALTLLATLVACGGERGGRSAGEGEASTTAAAETSNRPLGAGRQKLDAGNHLLDLAPLDHTAIRPTHLPKIAITVPDGWFNYDGWAVRKGPDLPPPVFVTLWDVAGVYPTPCKWTGKALVQPGRDVNGLASALAKQPLRNATAPTATTLAGYRGKYLELSVPTGIEFDDCDEGSFESWTANGWSSDRYQQKPGQVDRIWILDVDGQRLVVDASYLPEATGRDRAELERVVNSIRFLD